MITCYVKLMKKAVNLVEKLQSDITTGKREIRENYGQREVRQFIDKILNPADLTYQENCNIKDILYEVSNIC